MTRVFKIIIIIMLWITTTIVNAFVRITGAGMCPFNCIFLPKPSIVGLKVPQPAGDDRLQDSIFRLLLGHQSVEPTPSK